jgi:glycosyltransferase involved in cell wall biosynthesis
MSQGRIYGICLVKDEDDIIAQSLTFAARHCERIFVIDTGSTDDTWNIVQSLAEQNAAIVPFEQTREPFDIGMRSRVYNAMHTDLSDEDWWLILDADEFLEEDPRPLIAGAMKEGADTINTWQIQFYFTDRDAEDYERGNRNRDRPIFERRRYYLIDWQETRLFRNDPRRHWNASTSYSPDWLTRTFRRRILNRHYQYRDPEQISKRLRLRYGHRHFSHVRSQDWHDMIRESRHLNFHSEGVPWRFSPSGVFYFYRRTLPSRLRSACQGGAVRRIKRLVTLK